MELPIGSTISIAEHCACAVSVCSPQSVSLTRATVQVRHSKIHARDCAECATKEGRIDEFTRRIVLDGDLDDAARRRLLEIADRCPVHRTRSAEVRILTSLVSPVYR